MVRQVHVHRAQEHELSVLGLEYVGGEGVPSHQVERDFLAIQRRRHADIRVYVIVSTAQVGLDLLWGTSPGLEYLCCDCCIGDRGHSSNQRKVELLTVCLLRRRNAPDEGYCAVRQANAKFTEVTLKRFMGSRGRFVRCVAGHHVSV